MTFLLRLLLLCSLAGPAQADRPGLEPFLEQVRARRLDTLPRWIALGRWEGRPGSWKGGIDGGYFYLDSAGQADPARELDATIRALASEADLSPFARDTTALRIHPRLKYRARTRFLRDQGMPDSLLAVVDTTRWMRWRDGVRPSRASLIYASSYLGNPASMFGHVLLRFDAQDRTGLKDRLNYAITYGAGMPPGDPLYVPKGLLGLYPGFITILPYYLSLQKYKYLESRDLWEYPLDLDSVQTEMLLEMVWESGAAWNRYYFFTENCATGLARLFDVLQPDSAWSDRFASPSMPPELVRLFHDRGFAKDPVRRPSQLAWFLERRDALNSLERASLRKLVDGDWSDTARWTPDQEVALLDAGIDYLGWKRRNHPEDSVFKLRLDSLLFRRAALQRPPSEVAFRRGIVKPPEQGHRPRRVSGWIGRDPESRLVANLAGRVAYHGLEERPDGYLDGSEVEAGSLDLSWVPEDGLAAMRLRSLDIMRIRSVPVWDSWLRPWAWTVRMGARPFGFEDMPWAGAEVGRGLALGSHHGRIYGLVSARIAVAPWDHWSDVAIGPQGTVGLLISRTHATLGAEFQVFEGYPTRKREAMASMLVRWTPGRDLDLGLRGRMDREARTDVQLGAGWHF